METIFGEGTQDNEVVIDYVRKTVEFRPVIEYLAIQQQIILFGFTSIAVLVRIFLPAYLIFSIAEFVLPQSLVEVMINFAFYVSTISPFVFSFMYWNKEWRKRWYPEVNFTLHKSMWQATTVDVTAKIMRKKRFVIKSFGNIGLDYVVKGEFARLLERVEVKCIENTDDNSDWSATFFFSAVPKSGSLHLVYV